MATEENLFRNLPTDLIIEIFSRLPSKSIARFRCLSKQWTSTLALSSPYFTELFLTQSKTRPRLLFAVQRNNNEWCLYSSPQPQISYENSMSSLSITAEFYMSLPKSRMLHISAPILGLIYCSMLGYENKMVCNPSTRHLLWLPQLTRGSFTYLGYDPVDKQFSVVAITHIPHAYLGMSSRYHILKLGSGRLTWRRLDCPLYHYPSQTNICINGILHYIAWFGIKYTRKIVCFDLNSEEFKFIDQPCWPYQPDLFINFKGKLGGINTKWVKFGKKRYNFEVSLWVLEDVEKQEWSKHVYLLPSRLGKTKREPYYIVGVTSKGDVVLALPYTTNPLYVYFFNLEKKILRKIEFKGFGPIKLQSVLHGCVDYVEDLYK